MNIGQWFVEGYTGYAAYLWKEITFGDTGKPWWENYFYMLLVLSLLFLALEWTRPWRKQQARFRKDFWLDAFYMFFNFFLFSLVIYHAASYALVHWIDARVLDLTGFDLSSSNPMRDWPRWAILLTGFVIMDFIQWNIHRLLHRVPRLWEFHKVHHSVQEMGFAAHLRYHWMETIVYKGILYLPMGLLGIGLHDFFLIHLLQVLVGHFNHANWRINLGPLHYLFNSPQMHIWHHAYDMPEDKPYGINFGITLSIWDYLFGTARIPHDGRDIRLGFPGIEQFPTSFPGQISFGFGKEKRPHTSPIPDEAASE